MSLDLVVLIGIVVAERLHEFDFQRFHLFGFFIINMVIPYKCKLPCTTI